MAKSGRKRKEGIRYPCGKIVPVDRLAKIKEAQARREMDERSVVLAQPHRRGNTSQFMASVIGRFVSENYKDERDRQLYYAAAEEYAMLVHRWRSAWGAPLDSNMGEGGGGGNGPSRATMKEWWDKISAVDTSLTKAGLAGPMKRMVVDDRDQVFLDPMRVKRGLWIIATELGRVNPKSHPFA